MNNSKNKLNSKKKKKNWLFKPMLNTHIIKYLGRANQRFNFGLQGMAQRLSVSCDGMGSSLA